MNILDLSDLIVPIDFSSIDVVNLITWVLVDES